MSQHSKEISITPSTKQKLKKSTHEIVNEAIDRAKDKGELIKLRQNIRNAYLDMLGQRTTYLPNSVALGQHQFDVDEDENYRLSKHKGYKMAQMKRIQNNQSMLENTPNKKDEKSLQNQIIQNYYETIDQRQSQNESKIQLDLARKGTTSHNHLGTE